MLVPLGIIPAMIGIVLFLGYLMERDDINKYLFLVVSMAFMFLSFFAPAETDLTGALVADSVLMSMGWAFGVISGIFLLVLVIRLMIPAFWDSIKGMFKW